MQLLQPLRSFAVLLATTVLMGSAYAAETSLADVLAAFEAGDYAKVVELSSTISKESEDRPRAMYLNGEAELLRGRASHAETAFEEVLEARPEAVPALVGLGRALLAQEDAAAGEVHVVAALELEPKDLEATRVLGEIFAATDRIKEAEKQLEKAFKMDAGDPQVARARTLLYLQQGDLKKAAKVASKFSKKRKKHPMGPFLAGVVYERNEKTNDAIDAYQEALKRDETFLDAHKNLAILCHTMSQTYSIKKLVDLSLKHYERYFELGGKDPKLEQLYQQMKGFLRPEKSSE